MDVANLTETFLAFVRANAAWAPVIIFALTFAESMAVLSLFVPAWALIVAFGPLVGSAGIDFWPVLLGAAGGAIVGDWVSYWIGRYFKDDIGRMWPFRNHPDLLPKGQSFFDKWGVWAIFIGRFSGPLRATVPLIAGMVNMPQAKFQIANVLSAFIWAGALLAPGNFLGQYLKMIH